MLEITLAYSLPVSGQSSCYIILYTRDRIIFLMVTSPCYSGYIYSLAHNYLQNKKHIPS